MHLLSHWMLILIQNLQELKTRSESSKDLFCILEIFLTFFILKALERTGKETVPTAIPAIARLI